jgi:hypothetical protein
MDASTVVNAIDDIPAIKTTQLVRQSYGINKQTVIGCSA